MAINVIEQMLEDLDEKRARDIISELPEYREIRRYLNADVLLEHLTHTHGVIRDKYEIESTSDSGDRIQCRGRSFDVFEFMADEMHLKTKDFMPILRYLYYRSQVGRSLYYLNKISNDLQSLAQIAQQAHASKGLTDDDFRQFLLRLKDVGELAKSGQKMTPWMVGGAIGQP